jgi:hypothetical protein
MASALVVAEVALKVISIFTTVAKTIQSASSGYEAEFHRLMNEVQALRNDVQGLGDRLLDAIGSLQTNLDRINLIRMYSVAENALIDLQRVRTRSDDAAVVLRDSIITRSGDAVTELTNNQTFRDFSFQATGFFIYGVTIRLQVLRELVPNFYKQEPYRTQIREWVTILRRNADRWESSIRASNPTIRRKDEEDCEFDPETRRVICDLLSVNYQDSNQTGTVSL